MSKTQISQASKNRMLTRIMFVLIGVVQLYVIISGIYMRMEMGREIDWMSYVPNIGLVIIFLTWAFMSEEFFVRGDERLNAIRKQAIYMTFYFILGYMVIIYILTLFPSMPLTANQAIMLPLYIGSITLQIIHAILLRKN
ncbi:MULTISPECIES: hypothetical protein [Paenibacillus]|uniref:hypothetical protein n=1 Tax=Paenibacillus TaxID=44249 RepID=UPI000380C34F|nr:MULTISPECIES: hypothetical protein [Paenibacillus]